MLLELMGETILKVKGLVRHFGAVKAVDGIDFELKAGQVVDKGDLLISGIYDSKTVGVRYTRAAGEIMARPMPCAQSV